MDGSFNTKLAELDALSERAGAPRSGHACGSAGLD